MRSRGTDTHAALARDLADVAAELSQLRSDVVALYPLDADNFPVRPAIENNPTVKNHTDNRHGIVGYLDNPDVAKRILNALGG